jgi:hypothetical protein
MVERVVVPDDWSAAGINIDPTALSNIVIAQKDNMFCGVMNMSTKRIYLTALHGYAPHLVDKEGKKLNGYGTVNPAHPDAFPQLIPRGPAPSSAGVFRQLVEGRTIAPIKHKDPGNQKEVTSHEQFVIEIGGQCKNFCGFALRCEQLAGGSKGKIDVKLSPTSRTLNPNPNGRLEECIFDAVYRFLTPKLALLRMTLTKVEAGTNPDKAGVQRMLKSGAIDQSQVTAVQQQQNLRSGMNAMMRGAGKPSVCSKCNKQFTNPALLEFHSKKCK